MFKNILANYLGKIWTLISGFIFIPLYIKYLGFESYSIISFMLIISSVMMVLDAGLTASLSREFSRQDIEQNEKGVVYRTLETIYVLIFFIVLLLIIVFSDLLANNFFKSSSFSIAEISRFLKIVSLDISCQMMFKFYLGGLIGLEKHVLSNILQVSWSIIRNALVLVLIVFYPSLNFFFYWQAFATIIFTVIVKISLERAFFDNSNVRFFFHINKEALKRVKTFAIGMLLISLVAAINTQLDKIMISKFLPIHVLGSYNLGVSLSMGIITLVNPVSIALLPRITKMYSKGNVEEAKDLFDLVNGIISIVVFSTMAVLFFCAKGILLTWTGNEKIAIEGFQFLMILTLGNAMVALQIIPYCIAIANGKTIINNVLGLSSIVLSIPGYWFATKYYGAFGVAIAYSTLQFVLTIFYLYSINRLFLKFSVVKVFGKRMLMPLSFALFLAYLLSKSEMHLNLDRLTSILYYGAILFLIISLNVYFFFNESINILKRKLFKNT